MTNTLGINSFYYSEIDVFKKRIRNQLMLFEKNGNEGEMAAVNSDELAALFLIDADNIDGDPYTRHDLAIVEPILEDLFSGESRVIRLTLEEAGVFIELAMKRRLTLEKNHRLALKLAEKYNEIQTNELLRITDMDIFNKICEEIDNTNEELKAQLKKQSKDNYSI